MHSEPQPEPPEELSPRERAFKLLDQLRRERQVALAIFALIVIGIAGTQFMLGLVTIGQQPALPMSVETEPVEPGPVEEPADP